jgi:HD-GYP domain-containing protein (c-di-GMP phosphodiesterase class II)
MSENDKYLTASGTRLFKDFAGRVRNFDLKFAVYDSGKQCVFNSEKEGNSDENQIRDKLVEVTATLLEQESNSLYQDKQFTAIRFDTDGSDDGKLVGILYPDRENNSNSSGKSRHFFIQMLSMLADRFKENLKTEKQFETISDELSSAYEQLVLLNDISTHMWVTESDSAFLQSVCDKLTDIINVEGIAILLQREIEGTKKFEVVAGAGIIDITPQLSSQIYDRTVEQLDKGNPALVDSNSDSPFKYEWSPEVKSIITVPLSGSKRDDTFYDTNYDRIKGLLVAVNSVDKEDFDSTDIKLFTSVANACAVFVENIHLFDELKDLFLGSLKSLTSSIDAKDKYTHGHSERVAIISRWIARQLAKESGLSKKYVYQIYLAGLMHDVGKIGVDEAVLRKEGKLTDEEFENIKKHSAMGAEIIGGIKQMKPIVSGVLSHHERIDGRGYPDGLKGNEIPLIAKIVCLADSFDAMTSQRSYRNAMTLEQALTEIEENIGTQFDETVAKAFLNSDVYRLWNIIQQGYEGNGMEENYREYENLAVETLVR